MSAASEAKAKREERMQIRADRPDAWIAVDQFDRIVGTVMDVQEAWSDQRGGGSWYPLIIVRATEATGYEIPADGLELKIHAFSGVQYSEVMSKQPEVGERIRFTYTGDRPPTEAQLAANPDYSPARLFKLEIAGRRDVGNRVYTRIQGEQGRGRGGRAQTAAQAPASADDFAPGGGQDDDVPF